MGEIVTKSGQAFEVMGKIKESTAPYWAKDWEESGYFEDIADAYKKPSREKRKIYSEAKKWADKAGAKIYAKNGGAVLVIAGRFSKTYEYAGRKGDGETVRRYIYRITAKRADAWEVV